MDDPLALLGSPRRAEAFAWLEQRGGAALDELLALVRNGAMPTDVHPRDYLDDLADALGLVARAAPDAFLRALTDDAALLERFVVVAALGRLDAPRGVDLLERALASRHGSIRWLALEALDRRGDACLAQHLAGRLRDRDSLVRFAAARALRRYGRASDLEALERFLTRASLGARDAALDAIEAICAREGLSLPAVHPGERLETVVAELPASLRSGSASAGRVVMRVTEAEQVAAGRVLADVHGDDGLVVEIVAGCDAVVVSIDGAEIVLRRTPAR